VVLSVPSLAYFAGNENEVGEGIKDSGVPRSEIFITSKLWNTHQTDVQSGLQKSLDALGTDYLDLYVSTCSVTGCAPY
jgi:glycerol 2-dehydrogenase (NADP+)